MLRMVDSPTREKSSRHRCAGRIQDPPVRGEGGAEGFSQENPRQSGSFGHWCQGVQRDFTRRIPDSQDPPDTSARGCRRIPDSQDPPDTGARGGGGGGGGGERDFHRKIPDS